MSWTVQEDAKSIPECNLEEILQKVVADDEAQEAPVKARSTFTASQQLFTKSSQVFGQPSPLTPADLATPVKDPLESFNSWVRTQTPPSSRNSPTPTGSGYMPTSSATSPPSVGRNQQLQPNAMPFFGTTPQKNPLSEVSVSSPPSNRRHPPALDSIMEHRKQLIQQMEELALQELELRQGLGLGGSAYQNEWAQPSPYHHAAQPIMSAFSNGITADSIRGRVYETAKDQHGCRFLQRWLDSNFDGEAVHVIMNEIIPHVAELMTDQYANFLVQKLFDIMPHDIRYSVAQVAAPHIAQIALTPHGTFSVQKLIETIATREEMEIVRESLSNDVERLVKDVHGNHVIQKVLQRFEHPDKEFIFNAVIGDCVAIATNKQGCCVLQRCLEFASPVQHKTLVDCILGCCLHIVQDPFGNYVIQYVLEANDSSINDSLGKTFLPHLVQLCMNKFSSNVMEKVLRGCTQPVRDMYVEVMKNPDIVGNLIQDDFGNYVLQTALTMCAPAQAESLVAVIRPMMPLIKNAPYAKKLEAKMDLIMKKKIHSPNRGSRNGHHDFHHGSEHHRGGYNRGHFRGQGRHQWQGAH